MSSSGFVKRETNKYEEGIYICSPYKASSKIELERNIKYAQMLTRKAMEAGLAPIATHLYLTQCLDEDKPEEREAGMMAGLTLLKSCDFIIVGMKYGISEGMDREIRLARRQGICIIRI